MKPKFDFIMLGDKLGIVEIRNNEIFMLAEFNFVDDNWVDGIALALNTVNERIQEYL